jgi:GTPase SAR1 family protein
MSVTSLQYRSADFVILVFALNARRSFESLPEWFARVQNSAPANVRCVVVGNKSDLSDTRKVSDEEGEAAAKQVSKAPAYFTVSAVSGEGIDGLRDYLANEVQAMLQDREVGKTGGGSTSGDKGGGIVTIDGSKTVTDPKQDPCC